MAEFYFPVLFLVPDERFVDARVGDYGIAARRWQVSTFDLATLATRHQLHLPYLLMDVFLANCNLEVGVSADTVEEATTKARRLRAMLYLAGMTPFPLPFVATHSVNEYAGINSRDSESLRANLPEGLREGITSAPTPIEVWPVERVLEVQWAGVRGLPNEVFERAVQAAATWKELCERQRTLSAIEDALSTAPLITNRGQALLHVWTGLEALFPKVNTEVTFRLALYLAQLCRPELDRRRFFRDVKEAYGVRSRVAHGSSRAVTDQEWESAWGLLRQACRAILDRGGLPTENQLEEELLAEAGPTPARANRPAPE